MTRAILAGVALALIATSAVAQPADPHAGHVMPAAPKPSAPDPHAGHVMPASEADPHAGHKMPASPDPHAGHVMAPAAKVGADLPVGDAPPPQPPADNLGDAVYGVDPMARSRAILAAEHGGGRVSRVMLDLLEARLGSGGGYEWNGEAWYGSDHHRLVLKSEGEGGWDEGVEEAEVQALYSRPVGVYTDLQVGVRHDFEPGPQRTYATLGVESLLPGWFEAEGALFLSDRGELLARMEGSYDFRLTQRLVVQPRAELNFASEDIPSRGIGSGLSDTELALRLRYEIKREFAPYVGVVWSRKVGDTARFARAGGDDVDDTRVVLGLRGWF